MLGNSSGIILEETEDFISIGYVDFAVPELGDRDYECFYKLDKKNADLFNAALERVYTGDLFDMCAQAFTFKLSNSQFENFCTENKIEYTKSTY